MTAVVLSYILLVGTLAAAAAWCAEGLCRLLRRPTRWPWAVALAVTLAAAMVAPRERTAVVERPMATAPKQVAIPRATERGTLAVLAARIAETRVVAAYELRRAIGRTARLVPTPAAGWLGIAWLALSASVAMVLAAVYLRVRRARRIWPRATVHGTDVRVAPHAGPAVIGLAHPEIVVPRWLLGEAPDAQRLVLAHEREHLQARDPLLLAGACAAAALLPWHPAVWWMFARLRLAVEVDCDRRVLGAGAPAGRYGALLIDLAGHDAMLPLGAPALADRRTHLERRLLAMTAATSRFPFVRGTALVALTAVALLAACEARVPTAAEVEKMDVATFEKRASGVKIDAGPTEYYVDGVRVTPEMARNLSPESIEYVAMLKPTLRDDATEADRAAAPARVEIRMMAPGQRRKLLEGELRTATGARFDVRAKSGAVIREDSGHAIGVAMKKFGTRLDGNISVSASEEGVRTMHDGPTPIFVINEKVVEPARVHGLPASAVKSVEVLKGAAAIRKYGAAGANGAIVVTTKQP